MATKMNDPAILFNFVFVRILTFFLTKPQWKTRVSECAQVEIKSTKAKARMVVEIVVLKKLTEVSRCENVKFLYSTNKFR
jgi:hypothetical protein